MRIKLRGKGHRKEDQILGKFVFQTSPDISTFSMFNIKANIKKERESYGLIVSPQIRMLKH